MTAAIRQLARGPMDTISNNPGAFGAAASLAVIGDHFVGLVDVMLILTGAMWALYMVSGVSRAVIHAYTEGGIQSAASALDDRKAIEGIGRGLAVAFAVILLALMEVAQMEAMGGGYMPLVAPMLGVAFLWFAVAVAGQIRGLHSDLGKAVARLIDRVRGEPRDDDTGAP